jgi:hypothetical protein
MGISIAPVSYILDHIDFANLFAKDKEGTFYRCRIYPREE